MQPDTQQNTTAEVEEFVELLARHDQGLTGYVLSLVPSAHEAQDILQDIKLALWRSFDSYEPGTNFGAWARKAALNRVLDFRKRKARENKRLWFSDRCYELLAEECEQGQGTRGEQLDRLRECISKLPQDHRQILVLRYFQDATIGDVAGRVGRSVDATYRMLSRIRLSLRNCVTSGVS